MRAQGIGGTRPLMEAGTNLGQPACIAAVASVPRVGEVGQCLLTPFSRRC